MTAPAAADPFARASAALAGGKGRPEEILRRLELTITHRLDGLLQGNYLGLVPGHGSELGETREYVAGDDVRRIDWNVTARMQAPYIRQTIADRELETWLVVDRSPSVDFGTAACEKSDLVLAAAASIGFLTSHTGNRIGAVLAEPTGDRIFPARGGRQHLMSVLHTLATSERSESGSADLAGALTRLTTLFGRRGLVVVISDFLDGDAWQKPLQRLAVRHEVLAIEVIDPRELELPNVGMLALVDPESGRLVHVDTSHQRTRTRYASAALDQRRLIAENLKRAGADQMTLRTDRDWLRDIVRFVAMRNRKVTTSPAVRITR